MYGSQAALTAFHLSATYDALRLAIYRERGSRGDRIRTSSLGSAALLRFDEVGYFNRAYAYDDEVAGQLDELESFYRSSIHGCRLVVPSRSRRLARECAARGWTTDERNVWLSGDVERPIGGPNVFELREPEPEEYVPFFTTYLRGFGADPAKIPAAIENMRHLFGHPALHFLMALRDGRPAGVGVLYAAGSSALLCGGTTLPEYRRQGCHHELLVARVNVAARLGCTRVYAMATAGGQSHANMADVGLRASDAAPTWRFDPRASA